MQILPIRTGILEADDDLAAVLADAIALEAGDIIALSSKALATVEGAAIDLGKLKPSPEAMRLAVKTGHRSAAFIQAVLDETERLNGKVVGTCPGAVLTEVAPTGLPHGTILTANAGLDESNVAKGFAIGWPREPVESVRKLRERLQIFASPPVLLSPTAGKPARERRDDALNVLRCCKQNSTHSPLPASARPYRSAVRIGRVRADGRGARGEATLAVILTDSNCRPRRLGVTAFTLVACGIDPLRSEAGVSDLFGKELRITSEALADQLATAANFVMGNAGQSIPGAVIRDHCLPFSDFCGWVEGIEPEEDLFRGVI